MKKRKIAIILGSESDLKSGQCVKGLRFLLEQTEKELIEVVGIFIRSLHRNTEETLALLKELSALEMDAIIIGAGWANHLTGTSDAYLRYEIGNTRSVVVGVAFEDPKNEARTRAAIESIVHVPETQVAFHEYVGTEGFTRACQFAATEELPTIKKPEPRKTERFTLIQAIALAAA